MRDPSRGIEEYFRERYGREALYLPSGRMALYLAFREWLSPGDRLLVSPVNDDVVFFTVLAAGLVPVVGPLDAATGNLDPAAVDEGTWGRLKGVMTTNLYGIPDRMDLLEERCRRHGLLLIEDACQALDSRSGSRRIGAISPVSAFSLTKHVPGVGGILCFAEGERRKSLVRRAEAEIRRRSAGRAFRDRASSLARRLADLTLTRGLLTSLRREMARAEPEREGHRMPYDLARVLCAREEGGGLERFHPWVRVDNPRYRTEPLPEEIRATLGHLERFEENRRRRIEGTEKLRSLGFTPREVAAPGDSALFRLPLFVREREQVLAHFLRHGLRLDYVYDPPLDRYASPELAEILPSPEASRTWSRDVLPVDPLRADRFLAILKASPGILSPPVKSVR